MMLSIPATLTLLIVWVVVLIGFSYYLSWCEFKSKSKRYLLELAFLPVVATGVPVIGSGFLQIENYGLWESLFLGLSLSIIFVALYAILYKMDLHREARNKREIGNGSNNTPAEPSTESLDIEIHTELPFLEQNVKFCELLSSHPRILIVFTAGWCGPGRMFYPLLSEFIEETSMECRLIDVNTNPEIAEHYDVISVPTTLYFKDGVLTETIVGAMPLEKFRERVGI